MELKLNRDLWHVRWFFWSLSIVDEFFETSRSYYAEDGTNLCYFMRVTLIYAPIILLLHVILVGIFFFSIITLPIYLFGGVGYGLTVGTIAIIIVGVILLNKFTESLAEYLKERERRKRENSSLKKKDTVKKDKGPSFLKIVGIYIVEKKRKYLCPSITFIKGGVE